ncbi:MAG: leucine-rich repeat domain-containing protein, partial [Pseudomonadales bacterium]|nr:leucine-rich repeat domain-containing protein [Pseudomonadales bacterium]
GAFNRSQLASVKISNGVITIGHGAFHGNNLTSIVIPESVQDIGNGAFYDNPLENITILGEDPQRFNDRWLEIGFPIGLRP